MSSENVSRGIEAFNQAKYFEAHEDWEREWKLSVEPARSRLKALIQVCGVFVHLSKGRADPARRLALRALELFAEAEAHESLHGKQGAHQAGVRIPDVEEALMVVIARLTAERSVGDANLKGLLSEIRQLRAVTV